MKRPLRLLSVCAGIGGIDYAWSRLLGQEIAGQIEIDPYCQAVLRKQWPDVVMRSDIREVHGDEFGAIDLVAGGIPCQPFSVSGQRRGTEDDRHLWPEVLRIIEEVKPYYVCIENVVGFVSLALDLVQTDLESAGYTSQSYVLPACAIGAPHTRERVFIVAHSTRRRWRTWGTQRAGQQGTLLADGNGASCMAYSRCPGCGQWTHQSKSESQCNRTSDIGNDGTQGDMAHADRQRGPLSTPGGDATKQTFEYLTSGQSQPRMGRVFDGLSSWMDRPRWPSPPNQPQEEWEPPRTIPYKLKHRASRLKALGNAVVPQQVYPILKAIVDIEQAYEEMSE